MSARAQSKVFFIRKFPSDIRLTVKTRVKLGFSAPSGRRSGEDLIEYATFCNDVQLNGTLNGIEPCRQTVVTAKLE